MFSMWGKACIWALDRLGFKSCLPLTLISCDLMQATRFPGPWFPHLWNGSDKTNTCGRFHEATYVSSLLLGVSHCLVPTRCSIQNINFLSPFWYFYPFFLSATGWVKFLLGHFVLSFTISSLNETYFQSDFRMCLRINITNFTAPAQVLAITKGNVFLPKENTLDISSNYWAFLEPAIMQALCQVPGSRNAYKTF